MSALIFLTIWVSGLGLMYRLGHLAALRFYDVRRAPRAWWRP